MRLQQRNFHLPESSFYAFHYDIPVHTQLFKIGSGNNNDTVSFSFNNPDHVLPGFPQSNNKFAQPSLHTISIQMQQTETQLSHFNLQREDSSFVPQQLVANQMAPFLPPLSLLSRDIGKPQIEDFESNSFNFFLSFIWTYLCVYLLIRILVFFLISFWSLA